MACCIITAYVMNRLIKACEVLGVNIINIHYNQFDDGPHAAADETGAKDTSVASKFSIEGMTCAACINAVEAAVVSLRGVERVSVSLPLARATVVYRPPDVSALDITTAIEGAGYQAKLGQRNAQENLELAQHSVELRQLREALSTAGTLSSIVIGLEWLDKVSVLSSYRSIFQFMTMLVGIWVQLVNASWLHESAWSKGVRTLSMDTLISLSLTLGLALSLFNVALFGLEAAQTYFASGSFLTVVVIGGRYLDHLMRRRSASSLASLYRLQTESTWVRLRKRHYTLEREPHPDTISMTSMPASLLRPQDEIVVEQGAVIPVDCYVIDGRSMVDQSTMTGESVPVNKGPGEFLTSGTRNISYELSAIVVKEQQDSALEQLVNSISSATETHSQERGNDYMTSHFVRIILLLTLIAFSWTLSSSDTLSLSLRVNDACERAMAILASACPCALGLAAPSAAMAAIDVAWARGVILKGGLETVELLTQLTQLVMDKTGTLTTGKLSVAESSGNLERVHSMLLCAAERQEAQTHPVAQTIFQWAFLHLDEGQRHEQNDIELRNYVAELGKGVSCEARLPSESSWQAVHIGTASYLHEHNISLPIAEASSPSVAAITVYISFNHTYLTTLTLQDTIRPEAPPVISNLTSKFDLSITMLTGDVPSEAARVSRQLDIPVLSSQTLPHEKATFIRELKSKAGEGKVAMLGDGLNDTPALSAADVGIFLSPSMANTSPSQTPPQSSTSSIILTSPSLTRLPEILTIAHKTATAAKFIRRWAIAYNVIAVALAMGLGERWGIRVDAAKAGTMMALSSVSVMGWGLWLRHDLGKVRFEIAE